MKKIGMVLGIIITIIVGTAFVINGVNGTRITKESSSYKADLESGSSSNTNVRLSVIQRPKIDIVLSKARTNVDVNNFENDLRTELEGLNINPEDLVVSAVKTEQVTNVENFTWQSDVSTSIGSIDITDSGKNVKMTGNKSLVGKNAIWIMPTVNQEQKFHFGYNVDFGDSFKAAGMLLRVKEDGNKLTGYALSFNKSGQDYYTGSGSKNGALWKFTYIKGTNTTNMTKSIVSGINIATSGTIDVSATDSKIVISGGGMATPFEYNIPDNDTTIGNGYGFFTDHYSHNCDNTGFFQLSGINLETSIVRKFTEVLREPTWRDETNKFLVNVNDSSNLGFDEGSEILTRLLNDDIQLVSWGNATNQAQFQSLIKSNNNKGLFLNNADYTNAIKKTAEYIKSVVGEPKETQTIIVGEPLNVSIIPENIKDNTIDENWPYGKWKIDHDYKYYDNNMGQFSESGKYLDGFVNAFDKTGKYVITFQDNVIEPSEIYVHRRPIAQINMKVNGNQVTLSSASYDLDGYSLENHGIKEEEWKWKTSEEEEWHDGKLPTLINKDVTYIVQLKVKDTQDTWSTTASKYITASEDALPVSMFSVTTNPVTLYTDNVEINDMSYDPVGSDLTTYLWEVYKEGNGTPIYTGNTPKTNFKDVEVGNYTIYLSVTSSDGRKSEKFGQTIKVLDDEIAPEFIAEPTQSEWGNEDIKVHVEFADEGGSGFKSYQYAITKSQTRPTTYSEEISKNKDDIIVNVEGQNYLHIIAKDNAGNLSENRVLGIYKIDKTKPNATTTLIDPTEDVRHAIINLKATDSISGIAKIINPDGTEVLENESNYEITETGTYSFRVLDLAGNENTVDVDAIVISDGVEIKYIDQVTKEELADKIEITGNVLDEYESVEKQIDGYELVVVPQNKNGRLAIDKIQVVYEYRKNVNVITKYVDESNNKEIYEQAKDKYKQGDNYTTVKEKVKGYTFTKVEGNASGTIEDKDIEVIYYYKKNPGIVNTVKSIIENPDTGTHNNKIVEIITVLLVCLICIIKYKKNKYNKNNI